jgi:hypothetical protein
MASNVGEAAAVSAGLLWHVDQISVSFKFKFAFAGILSLMICQYRVLKYQVQSNVMVTYVSISDRSSPKMI